jgi:membrane-bound serine protease (ClpP class)
MAFLTQRALRAQMWKVATGREGLRGELGTALTDVEKDGRVFVHGEYWNATAREKISAGEKVRVSTVRDMVIEVERAERS